MKRTSVGMVAVVGLISALLGGCGDEPDSFGIAHVESNVPHVRATPEEAAGGSDIVRTVGTTLYAPLVEVAGDGNLAFSPMSIATALGMARAGAEGTSAEQLDEFFGVTADQDVHRLINGADETVRSHAGPVQLDDGETLSDIDVSTANALWGQSGVSFEQPFLDELRSSYDASMWSADYINDPDRARFEINDWVKGSTGEKIPELLGDGSITTDTRLVLTNAVYFKAPWPDSLDEYPEQPFTTIAGDDVQTLMLGTDGEMSYATGDGWQAVTLQYAGRNLGFTLLVPDEGQLEAVEGRLDQQLLLDAMNGEPTPVNLRFPAFDLETRSAVGDALKGLGVTEPFETDEDFLPITKDPVAQPLHIDDVVHQATVTVDKDGTEAAAATAVTFETVGGMIADVELTVDRPFLFVIHDLETSTPMFLGRVADPTQQS